MESALDTYLRQLRGATESLQAGSEAMQKYTSAKKLRELGAQMPEMIKEKGMMGFAGELLPYDPATARQLIKGAGGNGPTATIDKLVQAFPNVPRSQLETQVGRSEDDAFKTSATFAQLQNKDQDQGMAYSEMGRRQAQAQTNAAEKMQKQVFDRSRKLMDSANQIDKILAVADMDFAGVDRILLTNAAKAIGGDVGNIAAQEAKELVPNTAFASFQDIVNFIGSSAYSRLPPDTKLGFIKLFDKTKQRINEQVQDRAADSLNASIQAQRKFLFDKEGNYDPTIDTLAEEHGLNVKRILRNGKVVDVKIEAPKRQKKKAPPPGGQAPLTNESDINALIQNIQDPAMKAHAEAAVSQYGGKSLPPMVLEKIKAAAGVGK